MGKSGCVRRLSWLHSSAPRALRGRQVGGAQRGGSEEPLAAPRRALELLGCRRHSRWYYTDEGCTGTTTTGDAWRGSSTASTRPSAAKGSSGASTRCRQRT